MKLDTMEFRPIDDAGDHDVLQRHDDLSIVYGRIFPPADVADGAGDHRPLVGVDRAGGKSSSHPSDIKDCATVAAVTFD